jgi:hypothetical protein
MKPQKNSIHLPSGPRLHSYPADTIRLPLRGGAVVSAAFHTATLF